MNKKNRFKKLLSLAILAIAILPVVANAAVVTLIPDETNSTVSEYSGTLVGLTNDPFDYDPDTAPVPLPDYMGEAWGETDLWFHGSDTEYARIAFTFDLPYSVLFVDLYGRSDCCGDRDDSFNVEFWLGGTLQETIASGIDDVTSHARVTAVTGTWADAIRIIETNPSPNNFVLTEIRVNGVNDPLLPTVDAGDDMVTWADLSTGEPVDLLGIVVNNDDEPQRSLTWIWTVADPVDPNVVITLDPFVSGSPHTSTNLATEVTVVKLAGASEVVKVRMRLSATLGAEPPVANSMSIYVYDDPCKASVGNGIARDPADIHGEDCDTDPDDLALVLEKWLDDYSITEPVPKP